MYNVLDANDSDSVNLYEITFDIHSYFTESRVKFCPPYFV